MSLTLLRSVFRTCCVVLFSLTISNSILVQFISAQPATSESPQIKEEEKNADQKPDDQVKKKSKESEESPAERRERIRERAQNSMGSVTNLIGIPQIQKELDLSDAQRKQIADEVRSMQIYLRQQFVEVRKLPRSEQPAKIRELKMQTAPMVNERQAKILDVLTPAQRSRLTGISMQYRGVEALLDDQIADLLELTKEQREEILKIAEELDLTLAAERQKMMSQEFEDRQKGRKGFIQSMKNLRSKAEDDMLNVLTEEQQTKFEELQGEKFRVRRPKGPTLIQPPKTDSTPVPLKKLD